MSDGIHDSQRASDEAKSQTKIAQEVLSYLEAPTPTAMAMLRDMVKAINGSSGSVEEIVLRLDQNNPEEWNTFYNSSAYASQGDTFKNRFLIEAKKRKVEGF